MPRKFKTGIRKRQMRFIKKHGKSKNVRYTIYGKMFRTKKGILGCYKYVNGKRVGFVRKYDKYRR